MSFLLGGTVVYWSSLTNMKGNNLEVMKQVSNMSGKLLEQRLRKLIFSWSAWMR